MEEHGWELMKENVQPLRQGRTMSSLSKGLHADPKDEAVIRDSQRAFELELRTYEGEDPLDVWYRYIKWTEQHFPKGGHEGHLSKLIEKCLKKFQGEGKYANDHRFIKLWIEYSNFIDSPTEVFSYMFDNGVGTKVSQLYIEWATKLEMSGNAKKADSIYTEGLNRMAEPRDLLLQKQEQFQHRLAKNITLQMAEKTKPEVMESEPEEKRQVLTRLKPVGGGHKIGTSRTGAVSVGSAGRLKDERGSAAPKQVPSQRFAVFNDENAAPQLVQTNEWKSMPNKSVDSKENDRKPGVWTGAKFHQGRVASETPSSRCKEALAIYEDPAGIEAVTPMKTTNMAHKPLSTSKAPLKNDVLVNLRQYQSVPDLNYGIPMYPKDLIYNGLEEFSFEELRAIQYWKKKEAAKKEEERLRVEETLKAQMEEQLRVEEALKAQVKAQEKKLMMLESLLQSKNLNPQQSMPTNEEGNEQPMESDFEPATRTSSESTSTREPVECEFESAILQQTSSLSLATRTSPTLERKSMSAKQGLFVKKMEEAVTASKAVPPHMNESSDFITPTNLCGACPPKPTSSGKLLSSGSSSSSQRTPIFNSLSTYSSIGSSSGGLAGLKGQGRYNSDGRLLNSSSSFNQSFTKSSPAVPSDSTNTSICSGPSRNKIAMTAPSPTVHTKEAFQLVQGMFCGELDNESIMEEGVETTDLGQVSSSQPFQICEDKTEDNSSVRYNRQVPSSVPFQICEDTTEYDIPVKDNRQALSSVPFQICEDITDHDVPVKHNSSASSKTNGKKFGPRLSASAMEDVEMTETDKGHLQDFTIAHAQEDVTIASLSMFNIKACAASTPFHGRSDNPMPGSESVDRENSLPSSSNITNDVVGDDSQKIQNLSPILEGSEASSNSDNHTEYLKSTHHSFAIKSVVHEDSDEGLAEESHCDNQLLDATCHHIIDTSACLPPEETEALLAASVVDARDPFDKEAIRLFLSGLQPPISSYDNFYTIDDDVQAVSEKDMILLDEGIGSVDKRLGEGGYAQVFKMLRQCMELEQDVFEAMKVQKPPCHWEFYIACEIQKRLTALKAPMDVRPSLMSINCGYFNSTLSILVMKLLEHGSLLNLVNLYKCDPKLMGQVEPFACLVTVELLHLFQQLHKCNIIHGDVKPDNFLLMDLPVVCASRNPSEVFGSKLRVFCLTDFGQTIDMHMFPAGTNFKTKSNTDGFECIEMRTDRPWTYQTDLFGLAGTIHVLLFGSYMKVFVEKGVWKITGNFVRKWNVPLWKKLFHQLLNIPSCDNLPDLSSLRAEFEEYFCSNLTASYNEWACKVQVLLSRNTNLNSSMM